MKIEVIIATYDRRASLMRTLEALNTQSDPGFSVAVIDDCSPEPVVGWLDASRFAFATRPLCTDRNGGPAKARNLGVASSEADVVLFIDDDVVPDRRLIASHKRILKSGGPGTVSIGPLKAPADWKPTPWNRWEAATLEVEYQRMARGEYQATWRQFFTGNAGVYREDFIAVGGFDETFTRAEDIEFAYRLARRGARFTFEPAAIGWHYANRSLQSWRKIPSQYAEFDSAIARLHPELNWQALMRIEQQRRHPLTRVAERAGALLGLEGPITLGAIGGARAAHRMRCAWASNRLLSVAFQLEYAASARKLDAKQRFNPASTATS
ncbi:MAG: glycosyltransferase family 2 protein [Dehalococcoidia bacterium]